MKKYDIAVIGGGASGLSAVIAASRTAPGTSTAVLERLAKTGKKILATGNGRCNLSNKNIDKSRYHGSCAQLAGSFKSFSAEDFFMSLGVLCRSDSEGRIYPYSMCASTVLDALRKEAVLLGIHELCGYEVTSVRKEKCFIIECGQSESLAADNVIIAGGGSSQPALGSNGSALDICSGLGLKTVRPFDALVPLKTDKRLISPLKGQRIKARASLISGGKKAGESTGEVQFTDGLISGICVFDLSYLFHTLPGNKTLSLDLMPELGFYDTYEILKELRNNRPNANAGDILTGVFSKPVSGFIAKRLNKKAPLTDNDLKSLAGIIKTLGFPVTGTAGFERSQVTGGGVHISMIDDCLEAKDIDGLFICGEVLDVFGDCGGFNLHFAFSSGCKAGQSAGKRCLERKGKKC